MRGGKHVSDIAMLYPIYSLHSSVFFYDYDTNGYEYPSTPADADYMNVINSISLYSGHDVTVLHPDTLNEKCHVNDGRLYLDNVVNKEKYSILVLPATKVISIRSLELIAEFFDCGGKIIATGVLPSHAIESTAENNLDGRVRELVSHIFGKDADDSSIMRSYCLNTNINGGMAYMLYFSFTAADGTNMTDSASLRSALESFGVVFDIELEDAVKYEATGALNTIYPVFKMLGLASHLPNGGTVSHIHKRHGEIDVYYIANTTNLNISTKMTVAGEMLLEDWDPHTGRIKRLPCTHSERGGTKLTSAQLELPAAHSLLLVGTSVNI